MISMVSLIATIIAFVTFYVAAYKPDNFNGNIALIASVWIFPSIVFVSRISLRRKREMKSYRRTFFVLLLTIAFAIFWTVFAIVNWK